MRAVAERVDGVKIIQPPDAAKGWGSRRRRGRGWTARVVQYIKQNPLAEQHPEPEYLPADIPPPAPPQDGHRAAAVPRPRLGRGEAYYLPRDSRQVVALAARSHAPEPAQIAPLWYWMQNFEAQTKRSGPDTVDWTYAADAMMRSAKAARIFGPRSDPDSARGGMTGAASCIWDRPVIMDGRAYEVDSVPSRYTYEMARSTLSAQARP